MKYVLLLLTGLGLLACEKEEALPFIEIETSEEARIASIVEELNLLASPINSPLPEGPTEDLQAFDYLTEARIVGMGEATHGTKDFFQMKDRLFRYLVENHGFKAIIFEMDFAEALIFDDYVRNGGGSLDELMRKHMFFWIWTNREVRSLLQWMRAYNKDRPATEQLRFLGNDVQTTRYNAAELIRRVQALHPVLAQAISQRTTAYRQLNRSTFATAGEQFHQEITADLEAIQAMLQANEPELTSASSTEEYALLLRLSQTLVDTETLLFAEHQPTYRNLRDVRMADNSQWWTEQLGSNTKTAIWAHNLHVADLPNLQNGASMGHHLKARYGKDYQNLGFSFSTGAFLARAPTLASPPNVRQIISSPPVNSFHHYFSRMAGDNFLIRTANIPTGSATDQLFRQPLLFYAIGSSLIGENNRGLHRSPITPYFDAIIHFERTEAAEGMW
ncbi:MAG: erythromycin esterase family protein [Bacteroidota bacterium]